MRACVVPQPWLRLLVLVVVGGPRVFHLPVWCERVEGVVERVGDGECADGAGGGQVGGGVRLVVCVDEFGEGGGLVECDPSAECASEVGVAGVAEHLVEGVSVDGAVEVGHGVHGGERVGSGHAVDHAHGDAAVGSGGAVEDPVDACGDGFGVEEWWDEPGGRCAAVAECCAFDGEVLGCALHVVGDDGFEEGEEVPPGGGGVLLEDGEVGAGDAVGLWGDDDAGGVGGVGLVVGGGAWGGDDGGGAGAGVGVPVEGAGVSGLDGEGGDGLTVEGPRGAFGLPAGVGEGGERGETGGGGGVEPRVGGDDDVGEVVAQCGGVGVWACVGCPVEWWGVHG